MLFSFKGNQVLSFALVIYNTVVAITVYQNILFCNYSIIGLAVTAETLVVLCLDGVFLFLPSSVLYLAII